jgi:hypothetical protein
MPRSEKHWRITRAVASHKIRRSASFSDPMTCGGKHGTRDTLCMVINGGHNQLQDLTDATRYQLADAR